MALLPYVPPPSGSNPVWYPINSAQITALESPAKMLLFGGSSGGGKTDFLVADSAQEIDNPNYRGLIIRRSLNDFEQITDRCNAIYKPFGGRSSDNGKLWRFPSGAQIRFKFLKTEKDWENFQGKPYSWLGIDEAGHQTESRIRKILMWLAPTDPRLRPRVRMTANPGGVGAGWLMNLFLGGVCPIHGRPRVIEPGVIYRGSRWMSDKKETGMTTCFVPSSVKDNPFYGEEKINVLRMQEGDLAEKMLGGCWCELEGAYFPFIRPSTDEFESPYQYPLAQLNPQWWWNHFICVDYGYGNSSAAAGLFCAMPNGRKAVLEVMVDKKLGSVTFAEQIRDAWVLPTDNPENQPRTMVGCYYDPAMDNHTGTGKSNAELMAEVLDPAGAPMIKAAKDRIGGAQALLRGLSSGDLLICDTAAEAYDSLRTRIHDDKPGRAGDVKKVHGDPMDDVYDMLVYGYNNYAPDTVVPREREAMRKLDEMRESGMDETSLGHHILQAQMDMRTPEFRPMQIGKSRARTIRR